MRIVQNVCVCVRFGIVNHPLSLLNMFGRTILVLLLLWTQDSVKSIRITELRVPAQKEEGGTALLDCQYDLDGETLYSVKWYKDNKEIYRYSPGSMPVRYYKRPGVHIDKTRSLNTMIALANLTQESSGWYTCEVSGEAPTFYTVSKEKFIDIYLLPESGPVVEGLKKQYKFDEFIRANCSLPPTKPKADLQWFVNDRPAPYDYTTGPWHRVSEDRPDAIATVLQLNFLATSVDFINGELRLKCQATIAPLYQAETASMHFITQYLIANSLPPVPSEEDINEHTENAASLPTSDLIRMMITIFLSLFL